MPLRIADYVFSGDLRNTRRNSVFGWIEFAPDYGIRIELTGNFSGPLEGKHIRFSMPHRDPLNVCEPGNFPEFIEALADRQIGVVQSMDVRRTTVPALPIDDFLQLSEAERESNLIEKDCLYLEWASQDGVVVSELIEPVIEFVEDDDSELPGASVQDVIGGVDILAPDDGNSPLSPGDELDSEGGSLEEDKEDEELDDEGEEEEDDPYGLFDSSLQQRVAESLGADGSGEDDTPLGDESGGTPSWEEVLPGMDSATREMYEQWDEIFEGKKDEPISYLFPTPLKLPKPEHVSSEAEAEKLVKAILAQLALLSVALDVCEHFSMQQTYRLLMQEILPTAKVHPNLAASEMVQHYATSDYCQQCDDEFDAEYEAADDFPQQDDPEGEDE